MSNDDQIEAAVQAERDRCTQLLDAYRRNFDESSDKWMGHLWCRIRNQIANGAPVEEADFGVQLGWEAIDDEEFEDDELDDEFEDDDDEWHLDGDDHYPPPSQN